MLHETLVSEVRRQREQISSGERKIAVLDAEAQKLLRINELVPEIGREVFTTGATTSMGLGIPQGSVRDLIMVAVAQGIEWLSRKRTKAEDEIKRATARLAVVEQELSEKFGAAAE
jgi:hypothetical protein